MKTFATLPAEERELFFRQYQAAHGVDAVIVEKDFWVCWLLGRIFEHPKLGSSCVFKGGTSLSKVFGAIERFSEDIDLSITPASLGHDETELDAAESRRQRERSVADLEEACAKAVRSEWNRELEQAIRASLGNPPGRDGWLAYRFNAESRSPELHFAYPESLPRGVSYIAREVKMEFGSLTDQRPAGTHGIRALVGGLAPDAFSDFGAEVVALEIERTFWEKATILHAEYHRPEDRPLKDRHARHYADFAALWKHPAARNAPGHLDLLERVRVHKARYFSSSWARYDMARPGTLRIVPPPSRIKALRSDYEAMRQMFIGDPPPFDEILDTLREAEDGLNGQAA